jgi:hypothetical protein
MTDLEYITWQTYCVTGFLMPLLWWTLLDKHWYVVYSDILINMPALHINMSMLFQYFSLYALDQKARAIIFTLKPCILLPKMGKPIHHLQLCLLGVSLTAVFQNHSCWGETKCNCSQFWAYTHIMSWLIWEPNSFSFPP